ncbi:MAG TPA: PIN domain-containing protein [Bryobacteraceae bacterium]|nr:PIN domain-containing protein [Bryobacteraceae bacterium]
MVTTVIDSNVLIALWNPDEAMNSAAEAAVESAYTTGKLIVPAPVVAELMAGSGRTEEFVDSFLRDTGIVVEWHVQERIWRAAGRAFQSYAHRRRRDGGSYPRRILADFVIGAFAHENGYHLLTLDQTVYRTAFPKLKLLTVA